MPAAIPPTSSVKSTNPPAAYVTVAVEETSVNIAVVFNSPSVNGCIVGNGHSSPNVHVDVHIYRNKGITSKTNSKAKIESDEQHSPDVKVESSLDDTWLPETPTKVKPAQRSKLISMDQSPEDVYIDMPSKTYSASAPVRSLGTPPLEHQQRRVSLGNGSPPSKRSPCAAITKKGSQCKRFASPGRLPLLSFFPESDDIELFCWQHEPKLTKFPARRSDGTDELVDCNDYIPPYLQRDTCAQLGELMQQNKLSASDEIGWTYCFEMVEPKYETISAASQTHMILKIGRSITPKLRMDRWACQCHKEVVQRGCFPSRNADPTSLTTFVSPSDKGVWSFRLERLVHLELADLAVNAPYLQPGWKRFVKGKGQGAKYDWQVSETPKAKKGYKGRGNYNADQACDGCGIKHREIFSFPRILEGEYAGKEWDIVRDVLEGWARFAQEFMLV